MSFVMTIRRDHPIVVEELRQLVKDDRSLSILPDEEQEIGALLWNGEDPELPLAFQDGTLWSTPRNDAAIAKMQDISRRLGARLIGEDGGDFTDDDLAARKPAGCGTTSILLVVLLLVGTAIVNGCRS